MPTLPNIIFVILLALATGYLTFLTTKGGLTDNKFKKNWKKLTKRGRIVFYILLIICILLIWQEWNSQVKSDRREQEANKFIQQRDSIITQGIRNGVDSNSKKLFADISKAFANQGLSIDTLNKTIQRIQNPLNNTFNDYSQEDPVLSIDSNGVRTSNMDGGVTDMKIAFTSHTAGSTNFEINMFLILQFPDLVMRYAKKIAPFPEKLRIPKEQSFIIEFPIIGNSKIYSAVIYLRGKYTTIDGTKTYFIDEMYHYTINYQQTGILSDFYKGNIIKKLIPKSDLIPMVDEKPIKR